MQTITENTNEVETVAVDYQPTKGDRVYLRRFNDKERYGIAATIVSVRNLADGTNRVWFRYTDEQTGESAKDCYDIDSYDMRRRGVKWRHLFQLVSDSTEAERADYAQRVFGRQQKRAELARKNQEEREYMDKFRAENKHLVDRKPVWHPIEVVEFVPRRFEPQRDSRGIRLGMIYREIIVRRESWQFTGYGKTYCVRNNIDMRRESWQFTGYGKTYCVRNNIDKIKLSVIRGGDGKWRISTLPSYVDMRGDFQEHMVKLITFAHDWCVERNAVERVKIDELRAWRAKKMAA